VVVRAWPTLIELDGDDILIVEPVTGHGLMVEWLSDLGNEFGGKPTYRITDW
jgi:hypothetical protein